MNLWHFKHVRVCTYFSCTLHPLKEAEIFYKECCFIEASAASIYQVLSVCSVYSLAVLSRGQHGSQILVGRIQ